ncbi:MAG TPA: alpha/beta fold hydrolase [Longimicrobiales bacterium]
MMMRSDRVDRDLYPYQPNWVDVGAGRMHYVDEGRGPVIVMVHGTPTWSFLYRHLIRELSRDHRVIAADHLGFGLSDRPHPWGYRPEDHARNLETLIERLGLSDITLVVHDFGGPIGLAYALRHPENVRALVLFNTWLWSLRGSPAERIGRLMGSGFGRFLYTRLNFSPRVLVKAAFGDRSKLTRRIHRQYIDAFPTPADRHAPWVLARELIGSSDFYDGLWQRRERLADKPSLLLWGMKDPAFGPDALARWQAELPHARTVEFPHAGHFVLEEAPREAVPEIRSFLGSPETNRPIAQSTTGREI